VAGLDGRTQTARRFRDLVEEISNDLGGPSVLSEGQRQLIRRAASLSIMAEAIEADMARDTGLLYACLRVGLMARSRPMTNGIYTAMMVPADG
jgi:hypothetical protein